MSLSNRRKRGIDVLFPAPRPPIIVWWSDQQQMLCAAGLIDRPGLDRTAVLERPRTEGGEGARAPGGKVTGGGNFRCSCSSCSCLDNVV